MSKNGKWAYFGATIEIFGHDQNIRTPEKFYFCNVEQFRSLFKNGYTKLIRGYFSHTGCSKKLKRAILVSKIGDIWI